ncbi:MAG TPA: hypothetical protein VGO46_15080 [Gemmatimonadaceae bacterium]|nr:hypothetical protein [Gemmatimonadaceae bacterium]
MPTLIAAPTVVAAAGNKPKVTSPGEWVRYGSPESDGAEYIAVCLPAFSPSAVHRDAE